MSLLRKLTAKPWEHAGEMDGLHGDYHVVRPAGRTGLYLFLAVLSCMFTLLSITHGTRTGFPDWRPVAEPSILWINTAVLLVASAVLQLARNAARRGAVRAMQRGLIAAAALTVAFVGGQMLAWSQMMQSGFHASGNPANAFFFLFTGLHGLHLLGGLWFLVGAAWKAVAHPQDEALARRIGLCATYWHFLLLVWAVLFYLLLST